MSATGCPLPRQRRPLLSRLFAATFVLLCCCFIIRSATAASSSSDLLSSAVDSRPAAEWNRLALAEAQSVPEVDGEQRATQMAIATRLFQRAYLQQREEILRAQKDLRTWKRDLREAVRDEEDLALELAEAEADAEADAGSDAQGDSDEELAALRAESEAASREVASLRSRVVSSRASLRNAKSLAADYLNNKAVSLMRRRKMAQALKVLKQALRVAEHAEARKNMEETQEYLRRSKGVEVEQDEPKEKSNRRTATTKRSKSTTEQAEREAREERRRARRGLPSKKRKAEPIEDEEEKEEKDENAPEEQLSKAKEDSDESVYDRPAKRRPLRTPKPAANSDAASSSQASAAAAKPKPLMDRPRRPTRNPRPKLPRVHLAHMGLPENAQYAEGRAPFVLVGAMDRWNMTKFFPRALAQHFASSTVDFYPHNMDQLTVRPYLVPLSQALSEQATPTGTFPSSITAPGSYIQWNMRQEEWEQLREWMGPPALLPLFRRDDAWLMPQEWLNERHFGGSDDVLSKEAHQCLPTQALQNMFALRTHWRMVLIGNRGAGMFNHQDVLRTASYQAQVHGSKRWHLCAPSESRFLYGAGQVDTFDPDYTRFPMYEQSRHCFDDVVSSGEFVFYPADWWHQTENILAPSVALTGTIMDQNNHELIMEELKQECAVGKYNWGFSKELCESLQQHCFPFWRKHFGVGSGTTHAKDEL